MVRSQSKEFDKSFAQLIVAATTLMVIVEFFFLEIIFCKNIFSRNFASFFAFFRESFRPRNN